MVYDDDYDNPPPISSWASPYIGSLCGLDKEKLAKALATVRKYAFVYELNAASKKELADAMAEIENQRGLCQHDYKTITMFTQIETCCVKCGRKRDY